MHYNKTNKVISTQMNHQQLLQYVVVVCLCQSNLLEPFKMLTGFGW